MKTYVTFKHPYVLLEDAGGKHQPLYKEYAKELPHINLDSPTLCCPFTSAKRSSKPKKQNPVKAGYCEVCYLKFDDYCAHIETKGHISYASNNFNYRKVDEFIDQLRSEGERVYSASVIESPCDHLELEYSQNNRFNYDGPSGSESFIRLSKVTSENDDGIVPFDTILGNIERKYSQEK